MTWYGRFGLARFWVQVQPPPRIWFPHSSSAVVSLYYSYALGSPLGGVALENVKSIVY